MLKVLPIGGQTYSYGIISFALCSGTLKNNDLKAVTTWFSCRDYISDVLIAARNGRNHTYYTKGKTPEPDFKNLRLLVNYPNSTIRPGEKILSAVRALGVYEKLAGFRRSSRIIPIETKGPVGSKTYLIMGPTQWMKCSQLTSMVTFITRVMAWMSKPFEGSTIEELEKFWKESSPSKVKNNIAYKTSWDIIQLHKCWPKWGVLMRNFDEIFEGLTSRELYPSRGVNRWHGPGGIINLCSFNERGLPEVNKRFKAACDRAGV